MQLRDDIVEIFGLSTAIVYDAIKRGNGERLRIVTIRSLMTKRMSESSIKRAIKTLLEHQYIARDGEMFDCRGFYYRVLK